MQFVVSVHETDGRTTAVQVQISKVLLAGYTGRDRSRVLEHIRELETLGVAPPNRVPAIFTVRPELITTESRIVVGSPDTSGEVEFYLTQSPEGLLVGVGSDHTDRKHEAIDIEASKEMCPKAISRDTWRYVDVQSHWDQLELRAWATDGRGRQAYQEGRLEAFLQVADLLAEVERAGHAALDASIIFGGTLPTLSGFVFAHRFEAELSDPQLDRVLRCSYEVVDGS